MSVRRGRKEQVMDEKGRQRIVVGVRGSAAGRAALKWAAREARLRKASLLVVRAWDPARHAAPYAPRDATPTCDETLAAAREDLAEVVLEAFGLDVPAQVATELAEGVAERVLVGRSATADLLVLGTSSLSGHEEWVTGPVIRACLTYSRCPVVVIGPDRVAAPDERRIGAAVA
jgi:nucleotide-binding universal stress UspA family protein